MIVVNDRLAAVVAYVDRERRRGLARRALVGVAVFSAGIGVLVAALVVLPGWLAPRDSFDHAADAVRAQNDARGVVLQGVGGLIVVLGAYGTWLWGSRIRFDGLASTFVGVLDTGQAARRYLLTRPPRTGWRRSRGFPITRHH